MSLRFCVLGSGSTGNASYLEADGFGLLLDIGLGPRRLAKGLAEAGASWDSVKAVVLTHTHSDHWHDNTLQHLLRRRILFHCEQRHAVNLARMSATFAELVAAGLVITYAIHQPLALGPLQTLPFLVSHDAEPTCGFRIETSAGTLGYAADLGSWSDAIVGHLCDADILAVEFNHDVAMQRNSGRSPMLIDRVLGDHGHLSNVQGAGLVVEVLRQTKPTRMRHLVLLHLSQQCNHPRLAQEAATEAVAKAGGGIGIHVARHNGPTPVLIAGRRTPSRRVAQPCLPGWE